MEPAERMYHTHVEIKVFGQAADDQPSMTNGINTWSQILAQYYGPEYLANYNLYDKEYSPYTGIDETKYSDTRVHSEAAERREREPMRVTCVPQPRKRYQKAVRSKAPRHNLNDHRPTTTNTGTETTDRWGFAKLLTPCPTAVRSPAPRHKHTTKEPSI